VRQSRHMGFSLGQALTILTVAYGFLLLSCFLCYYVRIIADRSIGAAFFYSAPVCLCLSHQKVAHLH
jgi:hypothetical protein